MTLDHVANVKMTSILCRLDQLPIDTSKLFTKSLFFAFSLVMVFIVADLLIDLATTSDHMSNAEGLVYCVGSLKFLSGNSTVVRHLVQRHIVEALG